MKSQKQGSALVNLVGWYRDNSPLGFGKAKLSKFALKSLGIAEVEAQSNDGCTFLLRMPDDASWFSIYFDGNFETGTLELMKKVVKSDDVILDIGANLGWYTVHLAKLLPIRHCHAFEPVPNIYDKLKKHCEINGVSSKVTLNQCALGDQNGTIELHTFPDLPHGHSSISTLGKTNYVTSHAPMFKLDDFIASNNLEKIDFIKMDVEGAEALVLSGALELLKRKDPPVWVIELNIETAASFGHRPADLLNTLLSHNDYDLYKVDRGWGSTRRMKSVDDYENGDNAVCVPKTKNDRMQWLR